MAAQGGGAAASKWWKTAEASEVKKSAEALENAFKNSQVLFWKKNAETIVEFIMPAIERICDENCDKGVYIFKGEDGKEKTTKHKREFVDWRFDIKKDRLACYEKLYNSYRRGPGGGRLYRLVSTHGIKYGDLEKRWDIKGNEREVKEKVEKKRGATAVAYGGGASVTPSSEKKRRKTMCSEEEMREVMKGVEKKMGIKIQEITYVTGSRYPKKITLRLAEDEVEEIGRKQREEEEDDYDDEDSQEDD